LIGIRAAFNVLNWIPNRQGFIVWSSSDKIRWYNWSHFKFQRESKPNAYKRFARICAFLDRNEENWMMEFDSCQGRLK